MKIHVNTIISVIFTTAFTYGHTPVPSPLTLPGRHGVDAAKADGEASQPWMAWRVTAAEWARYRHIMAGPRGNWSPQLDPPTVLGVHARDDRERRRYAQLLLALEEERIAAELSFQRVYNRLLEERHGGEGILMPLAVEEGDELLLLAGAACGSSCRGLLGQLRPFLGRIQRLAVYADVEAREELSAWAGQAGLPAALQSSGKIRLARRRELPEASFLRRYGRQQAPLLLVRRQGEKQWQRLR